MRDRIPLSCTGRCACCDFFVPRVSPAAVVMAQLIHVVRGHRIKRTNAVFFHIRPVELERAKRDRERMRDKTTRPPFRHVVDVELSSSVVELLPHTGAIVFDEYMREH